jgi:hypothetical protein
LNVCGSHRLEHAGELIGTLDFILRLLIAALAISCSTFVLKAKVQEPLSGCYERADEKSGELFDRKIVAPA